MEYIRLQCLNNFNIELATIIDMLYIIIEDKLFAYNMTIL